MNVLVRASFTLFLSILSSPHLCCPHHHWATVEVVSGRGMMPNLTGVEPYLYSLHSRFCFKGFVYTRPINHLLPFHSPTAFKVGARPGDNVQHRCQCKSLSSFLKEGNEDSKTSGHLLFSSFSIISSILCPWSWSQSQHITPTRPQRVLITKYSHCAHLSTGSLAPESIGLTSASLHH